MSQKERAEGKQDRKRNKKRNFPDMNIQIEWVHEVPSTISE
jgi:hypothetical protein